MSGLEIPAFVVGVASLFSSCVDAFSYFKAAQKADEDVDTVLLKLDIEKARLVLWGNEIGLYSIQQQHPKILEETIAQLVTRVLNKLRTFLTASDTLRLEYGVVVDESSTTKAIDFLSRNGFEIFKTSSKRFWTKYAAKAQSNRQGSRLDRFKWAIYEKDKFHALVNEIKDLIDSLFELVPIIRDRQNTIFQADIESILDLSQLRLVEAATDGSYRTLSEFAGSVIEATENGTVDRRTVEEVLQESNEVVDSKFDTFGAAYGLKDLLERELNRHWVTFALTGHCQRKNTATPCDINQLGEQSALWKAYILDPKRDWSVVPYVDSKYAFWKILKNVLNLDEKIKEGLQSVPQDLLKTSYSDADADPDHKAALSAFLPLRSVVIYCSPCICQIHTSLSVCTKLASKWIDVSIRPDDRIQSSCCANFDRLLGLKSIMTRVYEDFVEEYFEKPMAIYLDRKWIERRLHVFENEQNYDYRTEHDVHVIIIGEADYLAPHLMKASGSIVKASQIWSMYTEAHDKSANFHRRIFEANFFERKHKLAVNLAQSNTVRSSTHRNQQEEVREEDQKQKRKAAEDTSLAKRYKLFANGLAELQTNDDPIDLIESEAGHELE